MRYRALLSFAQSLDGCDARYGISIVQHYLAGKDNVRPRQLRIRTGTALALCKAANNDG